MSRKWVLVRGMIFKMMSMLSPLHFFCTVLESILCLGEIEVCYSRIQSGRRGYCGERGWVRGLGHEWGRTRLKEKQRSFKLASEIRNRIS